MISIECFTYINRIRSKGCFFLCV